MDTTLPPQIDEIGLNKLGERLFRVFSTYKTDRLAIEQRWVDNLLQYRGVYSEAVKKLIPADRSKAYPRMTAWMVKGTVARLLQIAFPQTERNYLVTQSPMPDLPTDQLQQVLDQLVTEKAGDGDPAAVVLTDAEIEKAILAFAKGKAERMQLKVDDDMMEMDFLTLARKVVRSAVIYGPGVLEGPFHVKAPGRTWEKDQFTGKYTAKEVEKLKPLFEFCPVWEWYPDLTATSLDAQDGEFRRRIMTRSQVEELAGRPDFLGDRVHEYLRKNEGGNYQALWFESSLKAEPKSGQAPVAGKESRKFEVLSFHGDCTGYEIRSAGIVIPEADLGKSFHANVWMIDETVIKAKLAPLGQAIKHFHVFLFEEDELSIVGNGLPETLRDSQASVCETARAALDNMSVIGPAVILNREKMVPGQDVSIRKHMTIEAEDLRPGESLTSVAANFSIDSHLTELESLLQVFLSFADKESTLPPPSMGDTSGGGSEALRTSRNASMFLGAAALPVRDTLRNFDIFTKSVVSADVAWNAKYDPNPSRDGDHSVITRASTSLVAKEILAQTLNEFRASVTPDEAAHLNTRKVLMERMKANDLPLDLLEDEDKANEIIAAQQQAQQSQLAGQEALVKAQVEKFLSDALAAAAKARATDASIGIDVFAQIIEGLKAGDKGAMDKAQTLIAAHQADTARQVAEKPTPAKAAA